MQVENMQRVTSDYDTQKTVGRQQNHSCGWEHIETSKDMSDADTEHMKPKRENNQISTSTWTEN